MNRKPCLLVVAYRKLVGGYGDGGGGNTGEGGKLCRSRYLRTTAEPTHCLSVVDSRRDRNTSPQEKWGVGITRAPKTATTSFFITLVGLLTDIAMRSDLRPAMGRRGTTRRHGRRRLCWASGMHVKQTVCNEDFYVLRQRRLNTRFLLCSMLFHPFSISTYFFHHFC